jgi:hypothetical protein
LCNSQTGHKYEQRYNQRQPRRTGPAKPNRDASYRRANQSGDERKREGAEVAAAQLLTCGEPETIAAPASAPRSAARLTAAPLINRITNQRECRGVSASRFSAQGSNAPNYLRAPACDKFTRESRDQSPKQMPSARAAQANGSVPDIEI